MGATSALAALVAAALTAGSAEQPEERGAAAQPCFAGETPVLTEGGLVPIAAVEVGALVWAQDAATGTWGWHRIARKLVRVYSGALVTLRAGDDTVVATANHPLCVERGDGLQQRAVPGGGPGDEPVPCGAAGRWVEAGELVSGDALATTWVPVTVTPERVVARRMVVFDLEVRDARGYTVGGAGLLARGEPVAVAAQSDRPW
jgi:hypothetical protein